MDHNQPSNSPASIPIGYRSQNYDGIQAAHETGLHPVEMYASPTIPAHHSNEKLAMQSPQDPHPSTMAGGIVSPAFSSATTMMYGQQHQQQPHQLSADPAQGGMHGLARTFTEKNSPSTNFESVPPSSPPIGHHVAAEGPRGGGEQAGEKKILGLRRMTFVLTLSNILLAIGIVLVGVLLSKQNSSAGASTGATSCAAVRESGTPTSSGSSVPTTTGTVSSDAICFSTTTTPRQAGVATVDCPRSDNTTRYAVPKTSLVFERSCGVDIGGEDLGRIPVASMLDCLHLCAQLNLIEASALGKCEGVSWVYGFAAGAQQGMGSSYCYPKTNVTGVKTSRADTEGAVLV